jgi:beta-lactamase regulating signal transducer with metallopeptidase domain
MNPLLLTLCERSAAALFAGVWHGALLLAVVALALRLLPRLTAATRSVIWTVALILVVALPLISVQSAQSLAHVIDPSRVLHLNPSWSLAIAALWLMCSVFRAGQLALSAIRLHAISAKAKPTEGAPSASVTVLGLRRSAILCVSDEVAQPSVLGFFSPRILIPRDLYPRLSAGEIDHIILHEMEHLRRADDWRNLVQKLAVMLFPLNPALLWIERRLCFERELACDESVLALTHAPKSYAACLVHLAEERSISRQVSLALGAWERRSELGRRVHRILTNSAPASARIRTACASFVTVTMVASAVVLAKTPQLLSFNAEPSTMVASSAPAATAMYPMQTVKFTASSANQSRMIDTMMRIPAPKPAPVKARRIRKTTRPVQLVAVETEPTQQPRVVLASWTYTDGVSAVRVQRILYAVYEIPARTQRSSSETAPQPMPGGLFILQL